MGLRLERETHDISLAALERSGNIGEGVCVAQAQDGSAPDIAGRNIADPTSLILSAAMLLRWFGLSTSDRGGLRSP